VARLASPRETAASGLVPMEETAKRRRTGDAAAAEVPTDEPSPSTIQLRMLGFCGVDDSVDPALLYAISSQHAWVEWGVLFRPEKAGLPRFPSEPWLAQLRAANSKHTMRLAGHLCSSRVQAVLAQGETEFVRRMHEDFGFTRFQLNATKTNGVDTSIFATDAGAAQCVARLRAVFAALPAVEFIVQRNAETRPLWERLLEEPPPNMSMLFDDSMGLGVSSTSWPTPPPAELAFGYAGGLSPTNLKSQLHSMGASAAGRTLWVDMETSLRTILKDDRDIFDANKAMACVRCVQEIGLTPTA